MGNKQLAKVDSLLFASIVFKNAISVKKSVRLYFLFKLQ
jgi:hypothetical protein